MIAKSYIAVVIKKTGEVQTNYWEPLNDPNSMPKGTVWLEAATAKEKHNVLYNWFQYNDYDLIDQVNELYFSDNSLYKNLAVSTVEEFIEQQKEKERQELINKTLNDPLKPGDVVYLIDEGFHNGLILRVDKKDNKSYMLMVTSKLYWNSRSRKITDDEYNLLGIPRNKKHCYFAPVRRSNKDLSKSGVTYPENRIKDLIKEFK